MIRKANAQWKGAFKGGAGTMSTASGALRDVPYSVSTRFESAPGTNPEELVAAAHAGCFSMALSAELVDAGFTADRIQTQATLTLEKLPAGYTITAIHLDVAARVPGADAKAFEKAANAAKVGCPISRLLEAEITMEARLEG